MRKEKDPNEAIDEIMNSLNQWPELKTRPDFWTNLENEIQWPGEQAPSAHHWLTIAALVGMFLLNLYSIQALGTHNTNQQFLQNKSTEMSENDLFPQNTDWMNYLLPD